MSAITICKTGTAAGKGSSLSACDLPDTEIEKTVTYMVPSAATATSSGKWNFADNEGTLKNDAVTSPDRVLTAYLFVHRRYCRWHIYLLIFFATTAHC